MSWQDACDAKVDDVRMRLLAAVVHSAKHSSSLSSVHLHSESACGADIQLCTNQLCSASDAMSVTSSRTLGYSTCQVPEVFKADRCCAIAVQICCAISVRFLQFSCGFAACLDTAAACKAVQ